MTDDVDVLVVGAGPVGLVLAAELRMAGVQPVVIERCTEPLPERRARGLGPLAAEALRRRGLGPRIAPFHEAASKQLEREHGSPRQHFAWIAKIAPEAQEDPERGVSLIWQPDLVRVLDQYVDGFGITVHRGHEIAALEQDGNRVTATIRTPAGDTTIRARYLVGCDGGRSTVRGLAGFDFPGTDPTMIPEPRRRRSPTRAACRRPAGSRRAPCSTATAWSARSSSPRPAWPTSPTSRWARRPSRRASSGSPASGSS